MHFRSLLIFVLLYSFGLHHKGLETSYKPMKDCIPTSWQVVASCVRQKPLCDCTDDNPISVLSSSVCRQDTHLSANTVQLLTSKPYRSQFTHHWSPVGYYRNLVLPLFFIFLLVMSIQFLCKHILKTRADQSGVQLRGRKQSRKIQKNWRQTSKKTKEMSQSSGFKDVECWWGK